MLNQADRRTMQQSTSLKRSRRASGQTDDGELTRSGGGRSLQPHDKLRKPKRARAEENRTPNLQSVGRSHDYVVPEIQSATAGGHTYASSTVYGNGLLQNGDNFYNAGPGSQLFGPSTLNGNMRVQLTNTFYQCNHDMPRVNPTDDQERALRSLLYYTTMDDRKAQLARAEPASLEWVWTTDLPQFLEDDKTIFWISGKPASGKSTLIHYLSANAHGTTRVLKHLESQNKKWILIHFYFDFRAGKGIANTGLGMLRSFLTQLLDADIRLKYYISQRCQHRLDGNWPGLESELLDLICGAMSSTATSLCAFVDGLDEYEGSLGHLLSLLQEIQTRSSVKLCLASRPETELRYRLRECPTFAMQDYNHSTITAYIEAATVEISRFVPVEQLQHILFEEVLANADGVILWAIFAVDEAIKASLCGCTFIQVRQRLQSYPQELFSVYRRIWNGLAADDQRLAAVVFFIIEHWAPSFTNCYDDLTLRSCHLTVLTRSIVRKLDPSYEIEPDYTELHFRLRLHSLLSGLIEFAEPDNTVKIAHKSVRSFMYQSSSFLEWMSKISQTTHVNVLGPKFFLDTLIVACDSLVPDPAGFLNSVNFIIRRDIFHKRYGQDIIREHFHGLQRRMQLDCAVEIINLVVDYFASEDNWRNSFANNFDQAEPARLLISVSQTWLITDYLLPSWFLGEQWPYPIGFPQYSVVMRHHPNHASTELENPTVETSEFFKSNPGMLYLAGWSYGYAFLAILREARLKDVDYVYLIRVIFSWWDTTVGKIPDSQQQILTAIMPRLPYQARLFCLIIIQSSLPLSAS